MNRLILGAALVGLCVATAGMAVCGVNGNDVGYFVNLGATAVHSVLIAGQLGRARG